MFSDTHLLLFTMSNPFINSQQIFQRAVLTIYRMSKEPILKTKTIKETGNQMPYNASTQFKEALVISCYFFIFLVRYLSPQKMSTDPSYDA